MRVFVIADSFSENFSKLIDPLSIAEAKLDITFSANTKSLLAVLTEVDKSSTLLTMSSIVDRDSLGTANLTATPPRPPYIVTLETSSCIILSLSSKACSSCIVIFTGAISLGNISLGVSSTSPVGKDISLNLSFRSTIDIPVLFAKSSKISMFLETLEVAMAISKEAIYILLPSRVNLAAAPYCSSNTATVFLNKELVSEDLNTSLSPNILPSSSYLSSARSITPFVAGSR